MEYTVRKAPGWHGEPDDPVILVTDDESEAALRAGCRIDITMPGNSNKYDSYAVDENGDEVDRIESFYCEECEEYIAWGDDGPTGMMEGEILECAQSVEKHLVSWVCEECAEEKL